MKSSNVFVFAVVALLAACGASDSKGPNVASAVGTDGASALEAGMTTPDASSVSAPANEAGSIDFSEGGAPAVTTVAMPRISGGVPAFASSSAGSQLVAASANDDDMQTSWMPTGLPAWIAYDLSQVPAAERQNVLVVWNARDAGTYLNASPPAMAYMPTDYTIETNAAPGGTPAPPTTGWVQAVAVTHNLLNTVEHPVSLAGGNWVRMSITGATDSAVSIDLDVFSTPNGATDSWMFMGDSISYITMSYVWSDVPQLVHAARSDRWPAVINAAIGGTSTVNGVAAFDETIAGFPGRFVILAYGTNDHPDTFAMETLVQKVIAIGKVPVVPHMPWSAEPNIQTNGPLINQAIDALYAKYPEILPGPDLWAAFTNRTDLIPADDVHPNSAGQEFLRQQWATVIAAVP